MRCRRSLRVDRRASGLLQLPDERHIPAASPGLSTNVASLRRRCQRKFSALETMAIGSACLLLCLISSPRCEASALNAFGDLSFVAAIPNFANGDTANDDAASADENRAQTGRAALVYIIGGVVRPGAVSVDPVDRPTLVQAVALAGGPNANALLSKVVLIREQDSGRTVITLNLQRILRGQDPDPPIQNRDIVFVPFRRLRIVAAPRCGQAEPSSARISIDPAIVFPKDREFKRSQYGM